jgi:hypothetical protein
MFNKPSDRQRRDHSESLALSAQHRAAAGGIHVGSPQAAPKGEP